MAKIVILETSQVFDSITAAARAVGVDPSNARKVVIGKRSSVGGYHFARVENQAGVDRARENVVKNLLGRQKKKAVSKVKQRLVNAVHDIFVDVNKRARNAAREGLLSQDPVLQKMLEHRDYWGTNKTGGYLTSKQHLRQFSESELKNVIEMISREKQEYLDVYYSSKNRNIASYARQFGLTNKQMEKYWYVLPTLYEMFGLAKQKSELEYRDIKDEISDIMQAGEGLPEDLTDEGEEEETADILDYIIDLKNFYQGNTKEALDDLLARYSQTKKKWKKRFEEVDNQ